MSAVEDENHIGGLIGRREVKDVTGIPKEEEEGEEEEEEEGEEKEDEEEGGRRLLVDEGWGNIPRAFIIGAASLSS